MMRDIFTTADVLLPGGISFEKWSVVACDQFSSEREYWERVDAFVGGEPSTLRMIIPEAYLEEINEEEEVRKIRAAMDGYVERGVISEIKDSFIYVERTQADGRVRRGLVGTIDLDDYEFSGIEAPILASEGTVLDRLPARIRVRQAARLELPHIMTFINDTDATVIEPLASIAADLPLLYDFELMEGGGHIKGMRVTGSAADRVKEAMHVLSGKNKMLMVIGDGNHSLAAAKVYWDRIKQDMGDKERESHPARRALVEVNNVYDPAISFEAIHRVIFDTDPAGFIKEFEKAMPAGSDYVLQIVSGSHNSSVGVAADCIGDMLTVMQGFLDDYVTRNGCRIDYIHGDDSTMKLAQGERCVGIIVPSMDKSELFATVETSGVFPRKAFSVGHAWDKRYYLECRVIEN